MGYVIRYLITARAGTQRVQDHSCIFFADMHMQTLFCHASLNSH